MGKIPPSIPDETTELAADSYDSQRTRSNDFVENPYCGNALEEDSDSEKTLQGNGFVQISGHGDTDGLEVESAYHAKKDVVKSESLHPIPLDKWLKDINSDKGIWTSAKRFRSNGKADKFYFHIDYGKFRSKPEVLEFIETGTVRGKSRKPIPKKRSANTTTSVHDYGRTTKIQRTGATTLINTSGSSGSTRGQISRACTKLPHGFV